MWPALFAGLGSLLGGGAAAGAGAGALGAGALGGGALGAGATGAGALGAGAAGAGAGAAGAAPALGSIIGGGAPAISPMTAQGAGSLWGGAGQFTDNIMGGNLGMNLGDLGASSGMEAPAEEEDPWYKGLLGGEGDPNIPKHQAGALSTPSDGLNKLLAYAAIRDSQGGQRNPVAPRVTNSQYLQSLLGG